jgi:hypothetical protein
MPPEKTRRGDARWSVIVSARSSRTSTNLVERCRIARGRKSLKLKIIIKKICLRSSYWVTKYTLLLRFTYPQVSWSLRLANELHERLNYRFFLDFPPLSDPACLHLIPCMVKLPRPKLFANGLWFNTSFPWSYKIPIWSRHGSWGHTLGFYLFLYTCHLWESEIIFIAHFPESPT